MTIKGYNEKSFAAARVTFREALEVLADPFVVRVLQHHSHAGNPRTLYVGKTLTERLLEIGVESMDGMDYYYHAEVARQEYKQLYEHQGV